MIRNAVTCILNGFRRPENLDRIHSALEQQSIPPHDIWLWYNHPGADPGGLTINEGMVQTTGGVVSHRNAGVWARFAYALLAETEYVCIFDDDTIPGSRWLENCLNTIKQPNTEGLLGTIGLVFSGTRSYADHVRYGWSTPNEYPVEVDLVGHAWFFKREWLYVLFQQTIEDPMVGEDMALSFMLQKHLGIKTFVPPHPKSDPSLWGSLYGTELGADPNVALSARPGIYQRFERQFQKQVQDGWRLLCQRQGGELTRDFVQDLWKVICKIRNQENFALARYGDGELALIEGRRVGEQTQAYRVDGWTFDGRRDHPLGLALAASLSHHERNYYYMIPCQCCNETAQRRYLERIACAPGNISHANLFINGNYREFVNFFTKYMQNTQRPWVIVGNSKVPVDALQGVFNIPAYYLLEGSVVDAYETDSEQLLTDMALISRQFTNAVFTFSLGPLSNVLIDAAYRANPENVYLDTGSALDELFYGEKTRPYQTPGSRYEKSCMF